MEKWEKVKDLALSQRLTTEDIAKQVDLSISQVCRILKKFNLKVPIKKSLIFHPEIDLIRQLVNERLTDKEIAKKVKATKSTIAVIRKDILGLSSWRDTVELTDRQKSIIVGTVFGDSFLSNEGNSRIVFAHSIKQQNYFMWKYNELKSLMSSFSISERKRLENYHTEIRANPIKLKVLNKYREMFYINNIKTITPENISLLDELGLAVFFMDDGGKADTTYNICTNNFSAEGCKLFQSHLLNKWNIETTLNAKNVVRIRMKSRNLFTSIILPYIVPSMMYKIHQ